MVQVDIFWSYGLGAGLALAAGSQLKKETSFWRNPYFTLTLLWIALAFAPSGIYLLWAFPGWETMFVAQNHLSIPAWLVMLFSITNISQGVLGFYATWYYIRQAKPRAALMQTVVAHVCMYVVLIFGWDGHGYKRFFYAGTGDEWHQGVAYEITDFFSSPVFWTLISMGFVLIPTYLYLVKKFRSGL